MHKVLWTIEHVKNEYANAKLSYFGHRKLSLIFDSLNKELQALIYIELKLWIKQTLVSKSVVPGMIVLLK